MVHAVWMRNETERTADDVRAYVDLAGLGTGQYSLTVRADAAGEAGVTRIDPPSVQVRIASVKK